MSDDREHRVIHVDFRSRQEDRDAEGFSESVREAVEKLAGEVTRGGGEEALAQLGQTLITLGAGIVAEVEGMDELGQLLKDLAAALQLERARMELESVFPDDEDEDDED